MLHKSQLKDWTQYLAEQVGENVKVLPDEQAAARLPVFISAAYSVLLGMLFDQSTRFLVPKRVDRPVLPDLIRDYGVARQRLDGEVVLVIPMAPPHVVRRLVQERVPFIVPGRQIFLPGNRVALKQPRRVPALRGDEEAPLFGRAQAFLLYHLQKMSLSGLSQIEAARLLNWTPMTVSRCVQELQRKGFCHTIDGRRRSNIVSIDNGRPLWERIEPALSDPIMGRSYVRLLKPDLPPALCVAGNNALSRYSILSGDKVAVYAMHNRLKLLHELQQSQDLEVLDYREEDSVILEWWHYDPVLLSVNGVVDRLSLYLSLKNNPDERVQSALKELLEGIQW